MILVILLLNSTGILDGSQTVSNFANLLLKFPIMKYPFSPPVHSLHLRCLCPAEAIEQRRRATNECCGL